MDIYYQVSSHLQDILGAKKTPIREVAYSETKLNPAAFALLCETLKHSQFLSFLVDQSNLKQNPLIKKTPLSLIMIMLYELFISSNQKIQGGGAVRKVLMKKYNELLLLHNTVLNSLNAAHARE